MVIVVSFNVDKLGGVSNGLVLALRRRPALVDAGVVMCRHSSTSCALTAPVPMAARCVALDKLR